MIPPSRWPPKGYIGALCCQILCVHYVRCSKAVCLFWWASRRLKTNHCPPGTTENKKNTARLSSSGFLFHRSLSLSLTLYSLGCTFPALLNVDGLKAWVNKGGGGTIVTNQHIIADGMACDLGCSDDFYIVSRWNSRFTNLYLFL